MRKVIVYNAVSVDGFHTGLGNDVSVMFPMMGDVFDAYNTELLLTADIHLMGRTSFELFQAFWPRVTEHPESDEFTEGQRNLAQAGRSVRGIVVSDTLEGEWQGVSVIRRDKIHQRLSELKHEDGKDILITGSSILWNDLLAHGLVDEVHLLVGQLALGRGVPAFKAATSLRLIDVRTWAGSGSVLLRYEGSHASP